MDLTYSWKLLSMTKTSTDLYDDVIIRAYWKCTGTDPEGIYGVFEGMTSFNPYEPHPNNYIQYSQLTEEIILGWIKAATVGEYAQKLEESIIDQINRQKPQQVSAEQFPWIINQPTSNTEQQSIDVEQSSPQ